MFVLIVSEKQAKYDLVERVFSEKHTVLHAFDAAEGRELLRSPLLSISNTRGLLVLWQRGEEVIVQRHILTSKREVWSSDLIHRLEQELNPS
jgi:hypothetical protein